MTRRKPKTVWPLITVSKERIIQLAIDDFGVMHSSIIRLVGYDFDTIKIGKSFVDKIEGEQEKRLKAVIRTVANSTKNLVLCLVAEGVETEQ